MNFVKKCGYCQHPADLLCTRCLEVYCSVECQIRDWSEHKKICIPIPKLSRNDSYFEILSGGVALPPKSSITNRILSNNARSLRPLRKPNIASISNGELPSVEHDATVSIEDKGTKPEALSPEKANNINITLDCGMRMAKMSIDVNPERSVICDQKAEEEKPQRLSMLKQEIARNHLENQKKPKDMASTTKQREPWMMNFPLEKADGEAFEVLVHCAVADQPKHFWVILVDHENHCDKLLCDINGQVNPNGEPLQYDAIQVDDICTAPYVDIYYRAVVLEKIDPANSLVKIRLIDYGTELTLPAEDLRAPLALMKNVRAFAFLIEILNLNRPLEITEVIRISIVRSEGDRKVVNMDPAPLSLLHWLGNSEENDGEGGIVAILSPRKALVMLSSAPVTPIMKLLYTQLPEEAVRFPSAENARVGDLVCVEIGKLGWLRALIIEQHEDNRLVYTVDIGTVELVKVQDTRALPELYTYKPWLILHMEITKVTMNEQEFKRVCFTPTFPFTFERLAFNKVQRSMKCTIKDAEGKQDIAEVELMDFVCDLKKVGISHWQHIPQDKSIVKISSALDVNTIVICPKGKVNVFTEVLQTVMPNLKRLNAVPNVKDTVIAVDDVMMPYRARVLSNISSKEVEVLDLDNGIIKKTALQKLYETNGFVDNLPVYTRKVHILDMNVTAIKDRVFILDQLDALRSEKREFRMQFEGGSYIYGVKLIDMSTNRSLATILLERHDKKLREVEEAARKKREQNEERQKAAAAADAAESARFEQERKTAAAAAAVEAARMEQQRKAAEAAAAVDAAKAELERETHSMMTIDDLEMVALPTGKNGVKLNIMYDGDLAQGAVTVCELTDDNTQLYNTLNDKVNTYAAKSDGGGYCPKLDELCLAIFDEDKMWYRAACIKPMPEDNVFLVFLIDYGNLTTVKRESIRRLPKELAFACAAHTCIVKDHTKVLQTIAKQLAKLGHVVPQEIKSEGDIYSLKF